MFMANEKTGTVRHSLESSGDTNVKLSAKQIDKEDAEEALARRGDSEEPGILDYQLELENRIRNLLWTISGDYTQQMKPDVSLFLRSKNIALYDGIKQGALAKFFDKEFLGMYLVKKIFMGADEASLTFVSQLCIEEAIGERICELRPGIWDMQRKACEDILDQEYEVMPSAADRLGYLRVNLLRRRIDRGQEKKQKKQVVSTESIADGKIKTVTEEAVIEEAIIEEAVTEETIIEETLKEKTATEKTKIEKTITKESITDDVREKYNGIYHYINLISGAANVQDTMSLIRIIDTIYNEVADPDFGKKVTL